MNNEIEEEELKTDEASDCLGPLRELDLETQMECLKAKLINPEMFVSGFDVDDQGIEEAEDPNSPGERLLTAAEEGDMKTLEEIVTADPSILRYQDRDGYTALHRAAYMDHVQVIRYLVGKVDEQDVASFVDRGTLDKWTPLHSACHWNSFKAVRELVTSCNANVNAITNGGQTPLHIASNQQSRECMVILLTCPGIDPNVKNKMGETPLDLAKRAGRFAYLFDMVEDSINKLA